MSSERLIGWLTNQKNKYDDRRFWIEQVGKGQATLIVTPKKTEKKTPPVIFYPNGKI